MTSASDARQQTTLTRRVFISSTSLDLRAHRERVRDTLLSLGLFPVGMEHFGAQGTGDANSVSVERLMSCDVYLGIYAWRYGTVPAGMARSVTHEEYEQATRLGMPRYLFLAAPATDALDGADALFPATVRDPEHRAQLDAFRAEVSATHVVDFFTTPEDLAARVATALGNYLLRLQREVLAQTPTPPRDLPPRAPGFVGRDRELATLTSAFRRDPDAAAVALVGMAGAGKSALAAEAIHALANQTGDASAFPGGVAWVRCDGRAGLPGLAWVEDQVLAAWGITLSPDELARATTAEGEVEARERALRLRLAAKGGGVPTPALLLLDNVEPDLPLARALETLAPLGVRVLLTARHEPAAPRLRLVPLDVLEPEAAIELFAERYAARGGEWEASRDRTAAASIVEALGYLPLAIELAAARAARAHQGVAALAAELGEADRLGKLRDPLEPTHSVRYAFSRSLELLTAGQRARFALLGLPDGPDWPRPLVERLLAAVPPPAEGQAPADDLEVLAALSLVTLLGEAAAGARVRLHPLLRDLAREEWRRLSPAEQSAGIRGLLEGAGELVEAHTRDFAALAREEALIAGAARAGAQAMVAPEHVNALLLALEPYLDLGGRWRLGRELAGLQRDVCHATGDRLGEARALNNLGVLSQRLGDLDAADRAYAQSLAIRAELDDRAGQAETLSNLGGLARARGQRAAAVTAYQRALDLRREIGDRRGEGAILHNLGAVTADEGRLDDARDYYTRALAIRRETGDQAGEGVTLNNLGGLAEARGARAEASDYFTQALAVERAVGDRAGEGATLNNLGNIARAEGQAAQARDCYQQALAIRRETGDARGEGTTLHNLGILARTEGDDDGARDYLTQALAVERAAGDAAGEAATLSALGALARATRDYEAASHNYGRARALYSILGDRAGEAAALTALGELAQARADLATAEDHYEAALLLRRALGDQQGEALLLNSLGMLEYARGKPDQAAERFRQALTLLEATGNTEAIRAVRENLAALTAQAAPAPSAAPVLPAAPIPPEPMLEPSTLTQHAPANELADAAAPATPARRRRWPWSR